MLKTDWFSTVLSVWFVLVVVGICEQWICGHWAETVLVQVPDRKSVV